MAEVMPECTLLLGIRQALEHLKAAGSKHTMDDLRKFQQMLDALDNRRVAEGISSGTMLAPGQAVFMEALDDAYDKLEELISTASELNSEMDHIVKTLRGIQRKLSQMKTRKAFSLEDVRHYQHMLDAIDSKRADGIFVGSPKGNISAGQGLCVDVLASCYDLVEELQPIAEEMIPEMEKTFRDFLSVKRELLELQAQATPHHDLKSLQPFQARLDNIDSSREQGVFCGSPTSGRIPAGQALWTDLLNECYELVRRFTSLKKISLKVQQLA